ncbi:MAG: methylmalonate-semialdehyde dehydrogenase (CoA acylating) [Firmicutes bacterium HGW-Firmicutes-14]|nr:MAG: methylmalonate-semialdehyde dehydrogenase (CoA acylating) [Firmicutes bacterium HGW-Firmicutes-14]
MTKVRKLQFCVDGEWQNSTAKEFIQITNSSTGEVLAEAPCCTIDEVDKAVRSAKTAYPGWANTPVQKRVQILFRYKRILDVHLDELTLLVATELGKNIDESKGDILKAIEAVEVACSAPFLLQGDSLMNVSDGFDTVMYREPLGTFAGIVPYNFPAMIPFGWMIPLCIATGNTFVLKLANQVPQTGIRMLELLYEAGLPKGVVNLVMSDNEVAEYLIKHPDIKGVCYVGSTRVGRHVYKTAASHGKRVQALCQAKNHGLVLKDADLELTARRVINSSFGCAGQRCMALPVVVVEDEVADYFASILVGLAKEIKVGCAYDTTTQLGPVVTEQHKKSILAWIQKGIEEGAQLILNGRDIVVEGYENGYFIGPTIFDYVKPGMTVGEQEIFGPVVCIKRVKDFEEGITLMNSSEFANGSCIFTNNGYYAREFARRTHAGMVGINVGIPVPVSYFPFTGHKNSFFGDLHVLGKDGVAFFTEAKCVTTTWFDPSQKENLMNIGTWEGAKKE